MIWMAMWRIMRMRYHETLVVGGGLAGLRAAIELNRHNRKVGVLSKVHPVRSHSIAAQGGVNGALGNHHRGVTDSPEKHAFDTVKGSDYLADQDAALAMCEDAPEVIFEMEHWGCPFSRDVNGRIAQRPFGGAGFPRTCYAADKTGHVMLHTLYEQAVRFEQGSERGEMVLYEEWFVTNLIVVDSRCVGVLAVNVTTGEVETFAAEAVCLATGGAGRVFGNTTNALISTGFGVALGYWAGAALKDMEFVQFHPTTLVPTNILMTEGCRGEGGFLKNNEGERFLGRYDDSRKAMEVAPRDIIARNMTREIQEGRGFRNDELGCDYLELDLRHLGAEKIMERLPGIRDIAMSFAGIDPIEEPIPVAPGQHYTMGGVHTDKEGRCPDLGGLFAAGECACVSVHGANRLGGNSLLETLVMGKRAGAAMARYVEGEAAGAQSMSRAIQQRAEEHERELKALRESDGDESAAAISDELQALMPEKVGIFRNAEGLEGASEEVAELRERFKNIKSLYKAEGLNPDLLNNLELKGNLDIAQVMVEGALARTECRGSHFREDHRSRDDERWLNHTLAYYEPEKPRLEKGEVSLGIWEPKERRY
jgi:succinate dehydrogenase / fumarate reductase flavoprotein subunit